MNNAAYRKTMENLRNRVGVKFISNEKEYLKSTSEPSYVIHKIFDIDLLMIRKNEVTLTLNKPTHMGMCVLELNKVLMNEFHYDQIKNKYGNNSGLFFTDTDTLMYEVKTEVVYKDFSNDKEMFDFSNY